MEDIKNNKTRASNIELLRIISMFMILVIHANFIALPHIEYEEFVSHTTSSVFRFIIEAFGITAVNVFVFISGWFGINTSKKSVLSFLWMVMFWLWGGVCFVFNIWNNDVKCKWITGGFYLNG